MVKKLWKDPVWSTVIAAGIIAAATYLLGYWPQIWRAVRSVPSLLATPLSLPLWVVILAIPALLFAVPLFGSIRSIKEPRFLSYTSDTIFDINWSWRWLQPGFYNSHYTLHDLVPRCPSCAAVININDYGGSLVTCINENCSWEWERQRRHGSRIGHSSELDSKVRNEIDRRVHAGERG
jgi:hypothetical protein